MAWTAPKTWTVGEILTAANMNTHVRDNLLELSTHVHDGSAGEGSASIGPLVQVDFTDAAAPAAPGAGKTRIYAVSGRLRTRAGASGADSQLLSSLDGVAQGDVFYFNGTSIVRLAPGTAGQFLQTLGAAANPAWATVSGITLLEHIANLNTDTQFASISQAYGSLLLIIRAITDATAIGLRNNGISTASYGYRFAKLGAAYGSTTDAAGTSLLIAETPGTNEEISIVVWIPGYAIATAHFVHGMSANSPTQTDVIGGQLSGTAAITQLDLVGGFDSGVADLYGVPAA